MDIRGISRSGKFLKFAGLIVALHIYRIARKIDGLIIYARFIFEILEEYYQITLRVALKRADILKAIFLYFIPPDNHIFRNFRIRIF